ncbi:hypothetical protein Tco_0256369 [Tanacetum coccineum]
MKSRIHSEDGNPARANIKQALGLHKDGDADASFYFRNSDKYYHDPEEFRHQESSEQDPRTQGRTTILDLCHLQFSRNLTTGCMMPPKRTSTSAAPTMTEAAIRQLITDGVTASLEAQAAAMENANNPNRDTGPR